MLKKLTESHFHILESSDKEGREWEVVLIAEGLSLNRINYPLRVLEKARKLFEDAKAYALEFLGKRFDHLPDSAKENAPGGVVKNIVGWFDKVRIGEIPGSGKKGLIARFHIAENAKWLRELMRDAWNEGKRNLLGFSIDARGKTVPKIMDGLAVDEAISLERVDSVDVVSHPAAGGQFLRLVASLDHNKLRGSKMSWKELAIRLIEAIDKTLIEDKDRDRLTEADVKKLLKEAAEAYQADTIEAKTFKAALTPIQELLEDDQTSEASRLINAILEGKNPIIEAALKKKKKGDDEDDEDEDEEKQKQAKKKKKDKYGEYPEVKESYELKESLDLIRQERDEFQQEIATARAQAYLVRRLAECKLPDLTKKKIEKRFTGMAFKESDLDDTIREEEEYLAKLSESGQVTGMGKPAIEIGQAERDLYDIAFDGLLDDEDHKDANGKVIPRFRSLHEAFRAIASVRGEIDARELLYEACMYVPQYARSGNYWSQHERRIFENHRRLIESLKTSDFGQILGDSITRKMVREYTQSDLMAAIRKVCSDIVPLKDFRTQRRMRMGGYGILPTISERGTYPELTSPGDEEVTYSPSKTGGLESYTWEMALNDDVGALRRIPIKLANAALLTLYRDIFDMFADNLEQDGSTDLASVARSNKGTSALSDSSLTAARKAMLDQTAYGDDYFVLGMLNNPKFLLVPNELIPQAHKLTTAETVVNPASAMYSSGDEVEVASSSPNIHSTYGLEYIPISYWSDANNWWLIADPKKMNTIEIGFVGGQEEPELQIQNQPLVGSNFTADKITFKIRYAYGFAIVDYRAFYGAIVS